MSKSFAMAGCGSAGWRRATGTCSRAAPHEGLHDDLLVGAVRDPGADRLRARDAVLARSRRIVADNLAT
jgi:hypothetical protein